MARMSIREWKAKYNGGEFASGDVGVQIGAGWTDWRCPDSELPSRLAELAKPILRVRDGGKVDLDACWLEFVDDMADGKGYDQIRILGPGGLQFACTMDEPASRYSGEAMKWHAHATDKRYARPYADAWGFRSMTSLASWLSKPWDGQESDVVDGMLEIESDEPLVEADYIATLDERVPEIEGPVLLDPVLEVRGVQTREMARFNAASTLEYLMPADGRMCAVAFPMEGGALVCYATERITR